MIEFQIPRGEHYLRRHAVKALLLIGNHLVQVSEEKENSETLILFLSPVRL